MQVMNNDQFNQNEILIGKAGRTRSFKVSDDPMLMSMLSTSFYANPHRAMVQEVMFNAWDAHRMSKCQDIPIDIYINKDSGFVVRDYGPGIHDDKMEDVYCTYAASTKRDDEDQTGGFGLGSKSPWSYTESFIVTSHHQGVKTMYLMSRVSDDVGGKPGMTQLMSFATDETGLSVAVPLADGALYVTRNLVEDVLYLSGIKAILHFKDHEPRLIESQSVAPTQYVLDNREGYHSKNPYAVYGGVRYLIPKTDEYAKEFKFVSMISEISSLFIGFAPHTLSPLPNREGLNMSPSTKENIRAGLELCIERFQKAFEPMVHAFFRLRFDSYKENEIQPQFAMYHAIVSSHDDKNFLTKFREIMLPLVPPNIDETVWDIALQLMQKSVNSVISVMGKKRWMTIILHHFVRCYPEDKSLAFLIMKQNAEITIDSPYYHYQTNKVEEIIIDWSMPIQLKRLYEFEREMFKEFPEAKDFAQPKLRLHVHNNWMVMERHRNAPKGLFHRYLGCSTRPIKTRVERAKVTFQDPSNIWASKDGSQIHQFILSNTVVLAKTATALNDTSINIHHYFSKKPVCITSYCLSRKYDMIPAYVVHSRKGGYEKALKILTNLGFKVIEANEPVKTVSDTSSNKPKAILKQYARIDLNHSSTWQSPLIDPDDENYDPQSDGIPLTDPAYYLYIKQSNLTFDFSKRSNRPKRELVHQMKAINPDIAMVNNQAQADKLEKEGVKKFEELVINWYESMSKKVYRLRNIVRVIEAMNRSQIPGQMFRNQTIQTAMGITKIKKDDDNFWKEMAIINAIKSEDYYPLRPIAKQMQLLVQDVFKQDPQREKVERATEITSFFYGFQLSREWAKLSQDDREDFAFKISKCIRTMQI